MAGTVLGVPKGAYLSLLSIGLTVAIGGAGCALAVTDPTAKAWWWITAVMGVVLCLVVFASAAARRSAVDRHPPAAPAAEALPFFEVTRYADLPGRKAPPPSLYVSPSPPQPADPRFDFVIKRIDTWIGKLRDTQARSSQDLDSRTQKIGTLLGRIFGTESNERRAFRRAPELNSEPTCAHRLERRTFRGNDLQYRAEVFIGALERLRKHLSIEDIQRDFEPWDAADPDLNP